MHCWHHLFLITQGGTYSPCFLILVFFEVINFGCCNFVRYWAAAAAGGPLKKITVPSTFHSVTPRGVARTLHDLGYIVL